MAINDEITNEETNENVVKNESKASKKSDASFSLLLWLLFTLVVIASIPLIMIRLNILNAGEILRPYIKNESSLNSILPPLINPNDVNSMNREKLIALANENKIKLEELENKLKELEQLSITYTSDPNGFETFATDKQNLINEKEQHEKNLQQFANDKKFFYEQVVKEDMPQFRTYYEQLNPETAKELYELIMEQERAKKDVKDFVSTFETMESSSATKILEQMSNSNINLVVEILEYMEKAKSSKILSSMNPSLASRISSIMANKTSINR